MNYFNIKNTTFLLVSVLLGSLLYLGIRLKPADLVNVSEEEQEMEKKARVAARAEMEFAMTKDPATNTIPRERLFAAQKYADELRQEGIDFRGPVGGVTWLNRGPKKVGGRTRAMLFLPSDATNKTVLAGGVSGGLWKNTDITNANSSWTKVNDFMDNLAITCLAVDPNNNNIIYAGTGEAFTSSVQGNGVYRSVDGGNTWTHLTNSSDYKYVADLVVRNESGTSVVYIASRLNGFGDLSAPNSGNNEHLTGKDGVYRSADSGASWTQVLPTYDHFGDGSTFLEYSADDIDLDANNNLWVATHRNTYGRLGGGVFTCSSGCDQESNWTNKLSGDDNIRRARIGVSESDPNTIYMIGGSAGGGSADVAVFKKSTDGGDSWSDLTIPSNLNQDCSVNNAEHFTRGQAFYDLDLVVHPGDKDVVYLAGIDLLRSTDGGNNFDFVSYWTGSCKTYVHADNHIILFRPGNTDQMLVGNDGGIAFSTNSGDKTATNIAWAHHNEDYNVTQFYGVDIHPTAGMNKYIAGSQDNGTKYWSNVNSTVTSEVVGGDGAYSHIDQDNPKIQIGAYIYGDITVTNDEWAGGSTSNFIIGSDAGRFINPTDYDDANNILYGASDADKLLRIKDVGGTNAPQGQVDVNIGGKVASAVKIDPNTPSTIFVGTDGGKVYKVTDADGTPTPTDITNNISSADGWYVRSIDVQNGDSDHLLVTFGNYGVSSVWESTNGGTSWTAIEGNLPDMPVRWGIFSPDNNDQAFLATELGVWSTDNLDGGSTNWGQTNGGLANVRIDMIQYRTSDKTLVAGTHGRGLYTATLSSTGLAVELLDFNAQTAGSNIRLVWETANEIGHDYFEVLRTDDLQRDFKVAGKITATKNQQPQNGYDFLDTKVKPNQTYYYLLRMMDTAGKEELSELVSASVRERESVELLAYPNPAQDVVNLELPAATASQKIELYALDGTLISTRQIGAVDETTQSFDVSKLTVGTYFFRIETDGNVQTKQFIVQR